jgi:hypothetical protein
MHVLVVIPSDVISNISEYVPIGNSLVLVRNLCTVFGVLYPNWASWRFSQNSYSANADVNRTSEFNTTLPIAGNTDTSNKLFELNKTLPIAANTG